MRGALLGLALVLAVGCAQPAADGPAPVATEQATREPDGDVTHEDPRMQAALVEARKRFPEFRQRFDAGPRGEKFYVKTLFVASKGVGEYMWVKVVELEKDEVRGILENEPIEATQVKLGDPVSVRVDEVEDWCIYNEKGDVLLGQFSVKALEEE